MISNLRAGIRRWEEACDSLQTHEQNLHKRLEENGGGKRRAISNQQKTQGANNVAWRERTRGSPNRKADFLALNRITHKTDRNPRKSRLGGFLHTDFYTRQVGHQPFTTQKEQTRQWQQQQLISEWVIWEIRAASWVNCNEKVSHVSQCSASPDSTDD